MDISLYEYRDLLISNESLYVQYQAFYASLLTAYLAAAYLIGRKLTRFQVWAISILYVITMLSISGRIAIAVYTGSSFRHEMYDEFGEVFGAYPLTGLQPVWSNFALFSAGIILSLFYMWNARRQQER